MQITSKHAVLHICFLLLLFFFSVRILFSTHNNTWHLSFLIYLKIVFKDNSIQTTNMVYSYLQGKSVNYDLFNLFETESLHFKNFIGDTILFLSAELNYPRINPTGRTKLR